MDKVIKSLNLGEGKASDKNASIFSKTRWSSIAEGLAKRDKRRKKKVKMIVFSVLGIKLDIGLFNLFQLLQRLGMKIRSGYKDTLNQNLESELQMMRG